MLIYLHGFNSSPGSHKAQLLKKDMDARGLGDQYCCPALPVSGRRAVELVEKEIARHPHGSVTLVGSSLGGFYSTYLAERHDLRAVLINPAVYPHEDLRSYLGVQRNLYTGQQYELTEEHLRQWEKLYMPTVRAPRYLLLTETGDEVLDYRLAVMKYAGARQLVIEGGDHSLKSFPEHIPLILDYAGLARV
ncbi:MAG: esterase [Burkholderiales bacterium]|nr:esterase [Burkholderiales bacterium]